MNEFRGALRQSAAMRQFVLFGSFFILLLVTALAGEVAGRLIAGQRSALLTTSAIQCLLAFCLPAWLTARFSSSEPRAFLGLQWRRGLLKAFAGVLAVYFLTLPAMNQLIEWNSNLRFPEWASGLEASLRAMEEAGKEVTDTVLKAGNVGQMLVGIGIVGLLTGFSEELFFRGALQGIYDRTGCSRWVAVWGAAAIFSAIHFQFFGFAPRLLMGAFFGYLLLWSGSLWPAVFAHALNNSMVVVASWAGDESGNGVIDNLGIAPGGSFPWVALASTLATAAFLICFRKYFFVTNTSTLNGKEN